MKTLLSIVLLIAMVACSTHSPQTAEDIFRSDDYWVAKFSETFMDGGSVALGVINGYGNLIYLWANTPLNLDESNKQKLYLKLNYDDPNKVKILEGSSLESEILKMLEKVDISYFGEESLSILIDDFRAVLTDRTKHVRNDWDRELWDSSQNQELQPTVKTPVESGNQQGTAAEL